MSHLIQDAFSFGIDFLAPSLPLYSMRDFYSGFIKGAQKDMPFKTPKYPSENQSWSKSTPFASFGVTVKKLILILLCTNRDN